MNACERLGRIAGLWRYPTKSLRAQPLASVSIGPDGVDGDRRRALFLETPERARSGKTYRGKENNLLHTVDDPATALRLVESRGLRVAVHTEGPFFDAYPISLLCDGWVAELENLVGMTLDPLRFRPNLYVEAAAGLEPEAAYVGRAIEVGGVRLRVVQTTERCVTPTYDVQTGEPAPQVHATIALRRANVIGVYCTVEQAGDVAVGDAVTVCAGPPAPSPA